jgi:hypothetical protein
MLFQAVGMAAPLNILWPLAVEVIESAKGRMGALLVSFRLIISAIAISLASYFYDGSFSSTGLAICTTLTISTISCFILFKRYNLLQPEVAQLSHPF